MVFAAAKTMLFFRTFSSDWMRVVLGMADNSLGGSWDLPLGLGICMEGALAKETVDSSLQRSATQIGMMALDRECQGMPTISSAKV